MRDISKDIIAVMQEYKCTILVALLILIQDKSV